VKNKLTTTLVTILALTSFGAHAEPAELVFVPESQQIIGHKSIAFKDYDVPKTKNEFREAVAKSVDGRCQFEPYIHPEDFLDAGINGAEGSTAGVIRFAAFGTCDGVRVSGLGQMSYYQSKEKDKYTVSKFGEVYYQDRDSEYGQYLSRYLGHYPSNNEEFYKAQAMSYVDNSNRSLAVKVCENKHNYSRDFPNYHSCVESETEINNASLGSEYGIVFMRAIGAMSSSLKDDIDTENKKYQDECFGIELTLGQVKLNTIENKPFSSLSERCSSVRGK
jgi:hypothetical protein